MPDNQAQSKKDELRAQFALAPIAFLRQLANAHVGHGQKPARNTHILTWDGGKPHDRRLFDEEYIELLLDYILKLEVQLAIDASEFRHKSITELVERTELRGFDKAK